MKKRIWQRQQTDERCHKAGCIIHSWRQMFILLLLLVLLSGGIRLQKSTKAADLRVDEAGEAEDIGTFDDRIGGYSHVGMAVYWDDELECFALDTYQKKDTNFWSYVITNNNGTKEYDRSGGANIGEPIRTYYSNNSSGRFELRTSYVTKGRTDYSMILKRYYEGKLVSTEYGITGVPNGEHGVNMLAHHYLAKASINECGHDGVSSSYIYQVYSPRSIEPDGDELSLETHGGKMVSEGKAYVNEQGLILYKLPTATMSKTGYDCRFEGWYNKAEGGTKYKVGDILQTGEVLHARWSITPRKYKVICIDVRGDNPNGEELGRKEWSADYGTQASASQAGTDKEVGAYYSNCFFKGATAAKVTENGAVVYRYFAYTSYPVEYIDKIKEGTREGEILNREIHSKEFASTANGFDIGIDHAPNAYYEGYYYDSCTSQIVREKGTVVYRYFKPVKYTIELDGNGATEEAMTTTYNCEYDKEVTLKRNRFKKYSTVLLYQDAEKKLEEATEIKVKQTFLGWAVKKDGPVCYSDNETIKNITTQNEKITLYAVWSQEQVILPTLSDMAGYHFVGWAKDISSKTGFAQINVSDNIQLYAIWEKKPVTYHVESYKENLAGEYELISSYPFEGFDGETATLDSEAATYPGFSLDKKISKLSGTIKADGSLILCAYYCRNMYQLTYDLMGGSLLEGEELKAEKLRFGTVVTLPLVIPARTGYIFEGWSMETGGTGNLLQPENSFAMQAQDITLYAQWRKLSFSVKYDNNASYTRLTGITGEVPDTEYTYQKDSYASDVFYQSKYGEMTEWNTKPDGSGISVKPGTNIKGLFDNVKELTLYAIWKYKPGDTDIAFQIKLWVKEKEQKKVLDMLKLYGKAREKISTALLRIYQIELQDESVVYFYKGYEVVNPEELERLISLDSATEISLEVQKRKCMVNFCYTVDGKENSITGITGSYQEQYILPEELTDGRKVDRYEDNLGKHYYPGEKIILEKNLTLAVQQAVKLHDNAQKENDKIEYVTLGKDYVFPELKRNGYRFLGWYNSFGEFVGKAGQVLKQVPYGSEYYAKWSEPLTYSITYNLGNTGVKILENQVAYHQYTKETYLPNQNQVVVPEGYQFDGWYDSTDIKKVPITSIAATEYGDRVLCPLLSKKKVDGDAVKPDGKPVEKQEDGKQPDKEQTTNKNDKTDTEDNNNDATNNQNPGDKNHSSGGDVNVNQNGAGGEKNPENSNSGNFTGTDKTEQNPSESSGIKKQPNISECTKGSVFWYRKIKYRITSLARGNEKVQVIGIKKRALALVPSKVVYAGKTFKVDAIRKKAFYGNSSVKKLVIANSVNRIGNSAFAKMKNLKRVVIGKGIKKLEAKAFWKDRKLASVIIKSKKIKYIGKKTFSQIRTKGKLCVPKSKKKAYQRMLRKSGFRKTICISSI